MTWPSICAKGASVLARIGLSTGRLTPRAVFNGLIVLALVIGGSLNVSFIYVDHQQRLHEAENTTRNIARLLEEHARRTVQNSDLVVERLSDMVAQDGLENFAASPLRWKRVNELSTSLPEHGLLAVIGPDGNLRVQSDTIPVATRNLSDQALFQTLTADPAVDRFIGALPPLSGDEQHYLVISRRITLPDGRFAGVAVAAIATSYFARLHENLGIGINSAISILKDDGSLIVRQPMPKHLTGNSVADTPLFQVHIPASPTGTFRARSPIDGFERILSYRRVKGLPLVATASIAIDDALIPWRHHFMPLIPLAAIGGGLILGLHHLFRCSLKREKAGWLALQQAIDTLSETNDSLERRVKERTSELHEINERLVVALKQKDMLLREVNHRVKNNLQLVSSLLTLHGRASAAPEIRHLFTQACSRVATVAQIHQRLYQSDRFETVAFGGLLRGLCSDLVMSMTDEESRWAVAVDADEADLPLDQAIPLALIVNELITNAFKYAYPGGRPGELAIVFRAGRGSGGPASLVVADHGAGLPPGFTPERSQGLGMQMIMALAEQVRGSVRIADNGPGARFIITLADQTASSS